MPAPRVVVLEATALIALMTRAGHTAQPLRDMRNIDHRTGSPLVSRLVMTDQVFYEVTGIMPSAQTMMLQEFAQARKMGKQALGEAIENYVRASPRSGNPSKNRSDMRQEVRDLLRFIAENPDSLVTTVTGHQCDGKSVADHHLLSVNPPAAAIKHYRLSFGDAQPFIAAEKLNAMPLHLRQLYLWGIFDRPGGEPYSKAFIDLQEKGVTGNTLKTRWVTVGDFLHLLKMHHRPIPPELQAGFSAKDQLTPRFFQAYPELLPAIPAPLRTPGGPSHYSITDALAPSKLTVRQWMCLDVLPQDSASISILSQQFGFDYPLNHYSPNKGEEHLSQHERLLQRGFYEYVPTIDELETAARKLEGPKCDLLQKILRRYPLDIAADHRARLQQECHMPALTDMPAHGQERRVPYIGVPYEKAFSEALISGIIRWEEFMKIAKESGALEKVTDSWYATRARDLRVEFLGSPEHSRIFLPNDGKFGGRTGETSLAIATCSVAEILSHCRETLLKESDRQKFYRVFDAMLFHTAERDAPALRDAAERVLGSDRLARIEKDFSNRHYRKWVYPSGTVGNDSAQPAFSSCFAAMTSERRLLRKDMGELSCLEAAQTLSGMLPESRVFIANHDLGLRQHAKQSYLAPHVICHHSDVLKLLNTDGTPTRDSAPVNLIKTGMLMQEIARVNNMEMPLFTAEERRKWLDPSHSPNFSGNAAWHGQTQLSTAAR